MQFRSLHWQQVEEYLKKDDRCILPIGSTEQHAFLSLSTDSILAERVSIEAATPLNIPVLPVLNYGFTPAFMEFPGTITLRLETLFHIVRDILDSLSHHGFRRILIVNGHGGNDAVSAFLKEWNRDNLGVKIKFHNWWNAPATLAKVMEIDPVASHASWIENFLWTRIRDVTQPEGQKPMTDLQKLRNMSPKEVKLTIGDGNYGGLYQRTDVEMDMIWQTAIGETRALLETDW